MSRLSAPQTICVLALALFNGEDRRQRIVFDAHGGDGFAQLVLVRVRKQQDGFIAVVHLAVGEAGLIGKDELNVILAGNVDGGDDGELAPVDARVEVDGANEAARNGAAHRGPVPHAFALDVVDIARAAQQLVHAFFAGDGGANDAGFRARAHGRGSR